MKSYINLFRNYANFNGFLKRGQFWTAILIHRLIQIAALAPWIYSILTPSFELPAYYFYWVLPLLVLYSLLAAIPILSACVRRFHTLPRKGWWLLVGFIPVAGWFIVLIWLLQKGNYEAFEERVRRAGANSMLQPLNILLKNAEKPRAGGWFFVMLLLLAAGGWYLNRQIMEKSSYPAMMASARAALPDSISSVLFRDNIGVWKKTDGASAGQTDDGQSKVETDVQPAEQNAEKDAAEEPEKVLYTRLQPAENNPLFNQRDGAEMVPAGDDLFVSRYAVSVGDYRKCVLAGVCDMPAELNTLAYRDMFPENQAISSEDASLPMVYVTRDHAAVYCEWVGMRLPTESEWKEAAGTPEVPYSVENANCAGTDRSAYIKSAGQFALTVPVKAFRESVPDSAPVQMAGNVWEWTAGEDGTKTDLALGGSWNSYPSVLGADAELETIHGYSADNIGFRCFVDAENVTEEYFEGGEPAPVTVPEEVEAEEIEAGEITPAEEESSSAEIEAADVIDAEEIESAEVLPAEESGSASADAADSAETNVEEKSGKSASGRISKKADTTKPADTVKPADTGSADDGGSSSMTRPQDNAQMILIPGGSFNMGYSAGANDEKPIHEVMLSSFWMDAYEVTNAQYALCVAEGVCSEPHETKSFRRPSYYGNPEFENYPVIYVDWQQAFDYCSWTGAMLPTEAQWEYAAKGSEDNRYPWGAEFDKTKLNFSGNGNYDTLPVDATPEDISVFGVYNLGGNVSEWVFDRYLDNWYTVTDQPEDPTGPENGPFRVIRGASSQTGENNARTADRFYAQENSFNLDRGFRCVRPD